MTNSAQDIDLCNDKYIKLLENFKFDKAIDLIELEINISKEPCLLAANFIQIFFQYYQISISNLGQLVHPQIKELLGKKGIHICLNILKKQYNKVLKFGIAKKDIPIIKALADLCYILREYQFCLNTYIFLYKYDNSEKIKISIINCLLFLEKYEEILKYDEYNNLAYSFIHSSSDKAFNSQYKHILETTLQYNIIPIFTPIPNDVIFRNNEITLSKLENGCFVGNNPCIFKENILYIGNRITLSPLNSYLSYITREVCTRVEQAIVIYSTNPNNYYHFWIELISKLLSIYSTANNEIINIFNNNPIYLCCNDKFTVKLSEALKLLNIQPKFKTITTNKIIQAKQLYTLDISFIDSYVSHIPKSVWNKYMPSKESVIRLRNQLIKNEINPDTFIYISRRGHGPRSIVDDSNLTNKLANWAQLHNLKFKDSQSNLNLQEQINLYSRAKVIFGIHGGGLTNILFVPDNCLVCEIPILNNSNNMFIQLSNLFGIKHIYPPNIKCSYYNSIDSFTSESIDEIVKMLDNNYI